MEFNHRAVNQQASPCIPRPSDYSHVTDQSLRGFYFYFLKKTYASNLAIWDQIYGKASENSSETILLPVNFILTLALFITLTFHLILMICTRQSKERLKKQRIRQEIILSEIERRYALEAEVRMELRMEMELALRKGGNGFPFGPCPQMEFESPTRSSLLGRRAEGRSVEGRFAMSLEEMRRLNGRHESGSSGTQPFQRGTADLRISEAKHDDNISGSKRKAVSPLGIDATEHSSKKKAKEEWSCALCQVSATSERVLNDHLQGKKHKLKEAALKAERDGKKYTIGLSKRATKSVKVGGTVDQGTEEGVKLPTESFLNKKTGKSSSKGQDMLPLLEKIQSTSAEKVQKSGDPKNIKFWCEICNIGTPSQKVMNVHKKGKKHIRRLQGSDKNCRATSSHPKKILVVSNQAELVAENGKDKTLDNVDETVDKLTSEDDKPTDAVKPEDHELVIETKEENCGAVDITEPDDGLTNDVAELKGDDQIMT
ncbi:UNVERIFIED_CONTAM: hypothetical protein Slati_2981600 [Sesamum latifolium]|uniref:Uncharacterized protein n=1 Tax=Sesamum latifolium TaxID=2727402 RepID=A0AAW2VFY3_9LAMI